MSICINLLGNFTTTVNAELEKAELRSDYLLMNKHSEGQPVSRTMLKRTLRSSRLSGISMIPTGCSRT
jgi:hypothetical protein